MLARLGLQEEHRLLHDTCEIKMVVFKLLVFLSCLFGTRGGYYRPLFILVNPDMPRVWRN